MMNMNVDELIRAKDNGTLDGALQSRGELPLKVLEEVLGEVVKLKENIRLREEWYDAFHEDYD